MCISFTPEHVSVPYFLFWLIYFSFLKKTTNKKQCTKPTNQTNNRNNSVYERTLIYLWVVLWQFPMAWHVKSQGMFWQGLFKSSITQRIVVLKFSTSTIVNSVHCQILFLFQYIATQGVLPSVLLARRRFLIPLVKDMGAEIAVGVGCSYSVLCNCRKNLTCCYKVGEVSPLCLNTLSHSSVTVKTSGLCGQK